MKKLMVAALVATLGIAASAANCNWSSYATTADMAAGLDGSYWLVALGTDTGASSGFVVKQDGTYDFGAYSVVDSGTMQSSTYGATSGTLTGLTEADNSTYYALVVWDGVTGADGKYGVAEGMIEGIVANPPSDAKLISFDNSGMGMGLTMATLDTQAVPEPTSGLLLLLGVAGLALRRRRA